MPPPAWATWHGSGPSSVRTGASERGPRSPAAPATPPTARGCRVRPRPRPRSWPTRSTRPPARARRPRSASCSPTGPISRSVLSRERPRCTGPTSGARGGVVALLQAAGADPALRDPVLGCTPEAFGICFPASVAWVSKVRQRLAEEPRLVDAESARGGPLHEAAYAGTLEAVKALV